MGFKFPFNSVDGRPWQCTHDSNTEFQKTPSQKIDMGGTLFKCKTRKFSEEKNSLMKVFYKKHKNHYTRMDCWASYMATNCLWRGFPGGRWGFLFSFWTANAQGELNKRSGRCKCICHNQCHASGWSLEQWRLELRGRAGQSCWAWAPWTSSVPPFWSLQMQVILLIFQCTGRRNSWCLSSMIIIQQFHLCYYL